MFKVCLAILGRYALKGQSCGIKRLYFFICYFWNPFLLSPIYLTLAKTDIQIQLNHEE